MPTTLSTGNTVSERRLFRLPLSTLGKVANFEAGTKVGIRRSLAFTAAAYDVLPWGEQRVFSRFLLREKPGSEAAWRQGFERAAEKTGGAGLVRDNGYSALVDFSPLRYTDLELGYSRSVPLQLDTFSFSISFNMSNILRRTPGQ